MSISDFLVVIKVNGGLLRLNKTRNPAGSVVRFLTVTFFIV